MLDHAATSAIAPAGADLRVVANVRMVTPGRRVAALRVAMRVTVTEQDEDLRSVVRAVKQAVRTLALVALLVVALAAGTAAAGAHDGPSPAEPAAVAAGDVAAARGPTPASLDRSGCSATARVHGSGAAACTVGAIGAADTAAPAVGWAHAVVPAGGAGATAAAVALAGPWLPVVAESERMPRPALTAGVVPSPD